MKNLCARIAAAVGLTMLFGSSAFAQMKPMAPATPGAMTTVKSHVRHLKSGKTVTVKGYTRAKTGAKPKMTHVKSYTRKTKSGKMVTVKGYNRHAPAKKMKK